MGTGLSNDADARQIACADNHVLREWKRGRLAEERIQSVPMFAQTLVG